MRTRLVTASALFVALASLAGCGDSDSSSTVTTLAPLITTIPPPPTTVAPATTTAAPATTAAPSTTAAAPTTIAASTTTSTSVPAAAALVMRDDGIGDAVFGADPDEVVGYVRSILGPPTDDTGWADPFESFGICPGTAVRGVSWDDLLLLFSDESNVMTGRRHFFNYVYGPPSSTAIVPAGMRTSTGVGIGTTVADLRIAYPVVQVYPEEIYGPYFVVNENLTGFLTGETDVDTIISFVGGVGCGE